MVTQVQMRQESDVPLKADRLASREGAGVGVCGGNSGECGGALTLSRAWVPFDIAASEETTAAKGMAGAQTGE